MPICVVKGCKNQTLNDQNQLVTEKNEVIKFYRFPDDKSACDFWLENLDVNAEVDVRNTFVCSVHLTTDQLKLTNLNSCNESSDAELKDGEISSLIDSDSDDAELSLIKQNSTDESSPTKIYKNDLELPLPEPISIDDYPFASVSKLSSSNSLICDNNIQQIYKKRHLTTSRQILNLQKKIRLLSQIRRRERHLKEQHSVELKEMKKKYSDMEKKMLSLIDVLKSLLNKQYLYESEIDILKSLCNTEQDILKKHILEKSNFISS